MAKHSPEYYYRERKPPKKGRSDWLKSLNLDPIEMARRYANYLREFNSTLGKNLLRWMTFNAPHKLMNEEKVQRWSLRMFVSQKAYLKEEAELKKSKRRRRQWE